MTYEVMFQFKVEDMRETNPSFRIGKTTFRVWAHNPVEAINTAIDWAMDMPDLVLEQNNINKQDYRDGNFCRYYIRTQLTRIICCDVVGR